MAKVSTGIQRNWRGKAGSYVFSKLGSQTIARERVEQVKNPQTSAQMIQRVVFATVTQAADKMLPIIGISQQGVTDETESRRRWISQNVKLLREAALRMNKGGATEAAFAPKGNGQLIPNSYQVSKGSLSLAAALVPKTNAGGGASFGDNAYAPVGARAELVVGQTYTALELWQMLLGISPGDQLTFPQIYGYETAQALYGANGETIDRTRFTDFCAPRIVFRNGTETDSEGAPLVDVITISNDTSQEMLQNAILTAINPDLTWWDPVDLASRVGYVAPEGSRAPVIEIGEDYDTCFAINDDDPLLAIGCIRSHKNISNGKWEYSTSRLVCAWTLPVDDYNYFGFTLPHAVDTYLKSVTMDGEGNFLQTGTDAQIVPESFT